MTFKEPVDDNHFTSKTVLKKMFKNKFDTSTITVQSIALPATYDLGQLICDLVKSLLKQSTKVKATGKQTLLGN